MIIEPRLPYPVVEFRVDSVLFEPLPKSAAIVAPVTYLTNSVALFAVSVKPSFEEMKTNTISTAKMSRLAQNGHGTDRISLSENVYTSGVPFCMHARRSWCRILRVLFSQMPRSERSTIPAADTNAKNHGCSVHASNIGSPPATATLLDLEYILELIFGTVTKAAN